MAAFSKRIALVAALLSLAVLPALGQSTTGGQGDSRTDSGQTQQPPAEEKKSDPALDFFGGVLKAIQDAKAREDQRRREEAQAREQREREQAAQAAETPAAPAAPMVPETQASPVRSATPEPVQQRLAEPVELAIPLVPREKPRDLAAAEPQGVPQSASVPRVVATTPAIVLPAEPAPSWTGMLVLAILAAVAALAAAAYFARAWFAAVPPVPLAHAVPDPGVVSAPVFAFDGPQISVVLSRPAFSAAVDYPATLAAQ